MSIIRREDAMLGPLKRKVVNRNSVPVAGLREAPARLAGVLRSRPGLSWILLASWEERAGCRLSAGHWLGLPQHTENGTLRNKKLSM